MQKTVLIALAVLVGTAFSTLFYVHPDSTQNNIQACLDMCSEGDTVLVGAGTYYEHIVWPSTNGIRLLSEHGRDTTFIDGGESGRVIHMGASADSSTVVYGFTIQNGYVDSAYGAGIMCERGATPLIERNRFTGNVNEDTETAGGGIGCYYAHPLVRSNIFERNRAMRGGGLGLRNSGAEVSDNTFTANVADTLGGGIHLQHCQMSQPAIRRNRFEYDSAVVGGAIACYLSNPAMAENWVGHNHAVWCGGMFITISSFAEVIGDSIVGNTADTAGGGIGCRQSSPTIRHCVISDNHAPDGGGFVFWTAAAPDIDSCVIAGNSVCGVRNYCPMCKPTINHCNIFGNVDYGVYSEHPDTTLDAEHNWWGDSSGPYHPVLNDTGRGDTVGDNVDFVPWIGCKQGVQERKMRALQVDRALVTVVRGAFRLREKTTGTLLDIIGRRVMDLEPGFNDIRHVAPGVYFLRSADGGERSAVSVRKVVIQR